VAKTLEDYREKIGKTLQVIEWDGPCEKLEAGVKKTKITGFDVEVLDTCANPIAKKFVPVAKKDKRACGTYKVKIGEIEPKILARILSKGKFQGWISVY
jgi:hypothetical protein